MFYRWSHMSKYAGLTEADENNHDLFQFAPIPTWPKKLPPKSEWQPLELVVFEGEGSDRRRTAGLGDFIGACPAHVISEKAADALSDLWERYGELYPVLVKGYSDKFYVFYPTNVVDCLDYERSAYKGQGSERARFDVLLEFVFFEEAVGDNIIFTLPDHPHDKIYVTETFKERVKKAKLKGLQLDKKFFDPKPWKSG